MIVIEFFQIICSALPTYFGLGLRVCVNLNKIGPIDFAPQRKQHTNRQTSIFGSGDLKIDIYVEELTSSLSHSLYFLYNT